VLVLGRKGLMPSLPLFTFGRRPDGHHGRPHAAVPVAGLAAITVPMAFIIKPRRNWNRG
jgi:hypothetical protein